MQVQRLTILRLQKEERSLEREPLHEAIVVRDGLLHFHFCLVNLDPPFCGGYYHGLLELHPNYPFSPPKLLFYTPSGRFECNMPICTSFTNFHEETWTSVWNVRTLILATISLLYSNEPSLGCRNDPEEVRRHLAEGSLQYNLKNQIFLRLFSQKLGRVINLPQKISQLKENSIKLHEMFPLQELPRIQISPFQKKGANRQMRKQAAKYLLLSSILLVLVGLTLHVCVWL